MGDHTRTAAVLAGPECQRAHRLVALPQSKEEQAHKLKLPYQSRSALAREIVDFVATQLPQRQVRVLSDGG